MTSTQRKFRKLFFIGRANLAVALAVIGAALWVWQSAGNAASFTPQNIVFAHINKLTAGDGQPQDKLGRAVAVSADGLTLVAGAPGDDLGAGADQGSAYIYEFQNGDFVFTQQLFVAGANVREFGRVVATNGNSIAIGAPGEDNDKGAVYVFIKNGASWTQQQRLSPVNGGAGDRFGKSVSLDGNTLAVGTEETLSLLSAHQGSAFIFTRSGTTWSQQQKLLANDGAANDYFGQSVSLSGDSILVGANGGNGGQGTAYVYMRNGTTWSFQQELNFNGAAVNDGIGHSVALSGDTALVGAWADQIGFNSYQGAAYVFTRSGTLWNQQQKLTANDGASGDYFGWSVAVVGDRALIGAFSKTISNVTGNGAAYVYERSNGVWSQSPRLTPPQTATQYFGYHVAIGGNTLAAGAYADSNNTGAAHAYRPFNSAPQITNAAAVFNRTAGSGAATSVIATVSDNEQAANTLQITVNGGSGATVNGVTVSSLFVNGAGQVLANINVLCNAASGVFTLRVTDSEGAFNQTALAININPNTPPVLDYNPFHFVNQGGAVAISPASGPSDNGGVSNVLVANITPALTGTISTDSATGIVTISNAAPAGNHTVNVAAIDNCGLSTNTSFTLIVVDNNCPSLTVFPLNPTLPTGVAGQGYAQTFAASGGAAPYAFQVDIGTFPNGLVLNSQTGVLSGVPTVAGTFNFTMKTVDANGCQGTRAYTMTINPGVNPVTGLQFYPLSKPLRLLDTRPGQIGCDAPGTQIQANTSRTQIARRTCDGVTIPAGAMAVTGNITTVQSGGGYLTLYPSDAAQPLVANSNYAPNEIINNVFTVGLSDTDGAFKIFVTSNTHVVVDITGYYAEPYLAGLYFHPLPKPIRLLETRPGFSGAFTPGVKLAANADTPQQARVTYDSVTIPASALAIVGNATTLDGGAGYVTLYPSGVARPLAASSNFGAGQVMNAPFTVGLSASGQFNIFTTTSIDMVVDVLGYYSTDVNDANGAGLLFYPLSAPVRLLETRAGLAGCYTPGAPLAAGSTRQQQARGVCGGQTIAANALAIVGNATVVNNQAGFLTFWPNGAAQPLVASSNFAAGQILNRHFTAGLGANGMFNIFTLTQTDLVVDVSGFFAP